MIKYLILPIMFYTAYSSQAQFIGISDNWEQVEFPYIFSNEYEPNLFGIEDTLADVAYVFGKVYAQNPFTEGGTYDRLLAKFDGNEFTTIATVQSGITDAVIFHDELYVCGFFWQINGDEELHDFAKFENEVWVSIGEFDNIVYSVVADEEYIYAAGSFTTIDGEPMDRIARYDGESWEPLPAGGFQEGTWVHDLIFYQDELYACGRLVLDDGQDEEYAIRVMREGEWVELDDTYTEPSVIRSLEVWQDHLYMAGDFFFLQDNPLHSSLIRWDGAEISAPYPWFRDVNNNVSYGSLPNFLESTSSRLYAGGSMEFIGEQVVNQLASYDGSDWCAMYTFNQQRPIFGMFTFRDTLYARLVQNPFSNTLYPSGLFKWVGGDDYENCAPLKTTEIDNGDLAVFPNPTVDFLYLKNEATTIQSVRLYAANGVLIDEIRNINAGSTHTIDMRALAIGLYFLHVKFESGGYHDTKISKQ